MGHDSRIAGRLELCSFDSHKRQTQDSFLSGIDSSSGSLANKNPIVIIALDQFSIFSISNGSSKFILGMSLVRSLRYTSNISLHIRKIDIRSRLVNGSFSDGRAIVKANQSMDDV